jgi:hypothetical protein
MPQCNNCKDEAWVCEDHHDVPFDGNNNCCGGAGMPCKVCNESDEDNPPRMPKDMEILWDINRGYLS